MPSSLPWHRFKKAAEEAGTAAVDTLSAAGDKIATLRYGVDNSEKYKKAISGEIPGAKPVKGDADVDNEVRRASGYLFGKQWPTLARGGTALANTVRFTEDPALHETASAATEQGIADAGLEPPPGWKAPVAQAAMPLLGLLDAYGRLKGGPAVQPSQIAKQAALRRR